MLGYANGSDVAIELQPLVLFREFQQVALLEVLRLRS
jgi:hypothetical protein